MSNTVIISVPLALLVALSGWAGLFWPATYARETALWAAEGMGGDAVNLFVVAPVLVASALVARRGSLPALLVWMGTLLYLVYNFLIYAVAVHFNALFLVYCVILGGSFYALVAAFLSVGAGEAEKAYAARAPAKTMAAVLIAIGIVFAALWLREIIPAMISGETPKAIRETGLLTNPVHVLDLSVLLPAMIAAGILLWRRRPAGFLLAPILMVFAILMTAAIAGMVAAMAMRGFAASYSMAALFLAVATASAALVVRYFRTSGAA